MMMSVVSSGMCCLVLMWLAVMCRNAASKLG